MRRFLVLLVLAAFALLGAAPAGAGASTDGLGHGYDVGPGVRNSDSAGRAIRLVLGFTPGSLAAHTPSVVGYIYDSSFNFVAPTSAAGDLARVCRSFSADTAVLMADGTAKPISEIEVGDAVRAPDPETGEAGSRTVAGVWPHQDMLLDFNVEGGSVTTTEDHHFWNATDNEWQETQRIDPGDHLLTVDGQLLEAGHLDWTTVHYADAYDLTIDGIHTYYVEAGGPSVLVHNCNFSDHFLRQAVRRGVSREVAEDVVRQPVGSYWHDDLWKQGFYAPVRRTFVGQGPDGALQL